MNNFTHFCEQIISYQSLQVRIQKCQPIGGFNWGLEARRPLTYQINRCRRARKNWGSFLIKKKPIRKSVLLLIFASLDFFTDINNTKVCGLREIKNCLEKEMSM